MWPIALLVVAAAVVVGVIAHGARQRRRKADTTPQLHQHPERLEQNLDSSDDA